MDNEDQNERGALIPSLAETASKEKEMAGFLFSVSSKPPSKMNMAGLRFSPFLQKHPEKRKWLVFASLLSSENKLRIQVGDVYFSLFSKRLARSMMAGFRSLLSLLLKQRAKLVMAGVCFSRSSKIR
ncbi:hypothetical protein NX059_006394 [Plenodomus lindquistii]|nr:hypothetical protein NX059_006394 [Plenodomus lindquistii]